MVRDVLQLGDSRLRKKSEPIRDFAGELEEIKQNLKDTLISLREKEGLGRALAAPQLAHHRRVVFSLAEGEELLMVNPRIAARSEKTITVWDSCFSFDLAFFVKVERSARIEVEFKDECGGERKKTFSGDLAELYQHELDHLDGVLATDYLFSQEIEGERIITREIWESITASDNEQ